MSFEKPERNLGRRVASLGGAQRLLLALLKSLLEVLGGPWGTVD